MARVLCTTSAIVTVSSVGATTVCAQVAPEFRTGYAKSTAKTFARLRVEFGLHAVDGSDGGRSLAVGDEITERLDAFESVADHLATRLHRPLDVLLLERYDDSSLERMDALRRGAERELRNTVAALACGEIGAGQARRMVRAVFRSYLDDLQAIPHR